MWACLPLYEWFNCLNGIDMSKIAHVDKLIKQLFFDVNAIYQRVFPPSKANLYSPPNFAIKIFDFPFTHSELRQFAYSYFEGLQWQQANYVALILAGAYS